MSNKKSTNGINKSDLNNSRKVNSISSYDLGTSEWENSIMLPLKLMRIYFIIYLLIALIIPVYRGTGFFIDSLSTWISIIMLLLGLLSCYGRFIDFTPMMYLTVSRGVHFLLNFFFFKKQLNYLSFSFIFLLEIGLCVLYLVDNSRFECVKEKES